MDRPPGITTAGTAGLMLVTGALMATLAGATFARGPSATCDACVYVVLDDTRLCREVAEGGS